MTERDQYLATTDWLAEHLDDTNLRILDCTVFLRPSAAGRPGYSAISGRDDWAKGHIPGSVFADLQHDLSDRDHRLRFMMPPPSQFAEAMGRYGVGDGTSVVLYDSQSNMWAARIWWMLRTFGFDNARVLDGGWTTWTAEGRPVSTEASLPPAATFTAIPRPELIATKEEVLTAVAAGQTCIVNALNSAQYRGEVAPYGRPGRIAGSVNVPAMGSHGLADPKTQLYHPTDEIRRRFEEAGATAGQRIITYCGGGIAASSAAFAATMAGFSDVAVYDGSLSEWAADPSLPMEVG